MDDRKEPGPQSFFCEAGAGESNGEVIGTGDRRGFRDKKVKKEEIEEKEEGRAEVSRGGPVGRMRRRVLTKSLKTQAGRIPKL